MESLPQVFVDRIVSLIPTSRHQSVRRAELVRQSGASDRTVRRAIQQARDGGQIIINRQDGCGYYRVSPEDTEEIKAQYWSDKSRFLTIAKRLKAMRRILKEAGEEV